MNTIIYIMKSKGYYGIRLILDYLHNHLGTNYGKNGPFWGL